MSNACLSRVCDGTNNYLSLDLVALEIHDNHVFLKKLLQYYIVIIFRDEEGYCGISYVEASGQTIDTFSILSPPIAPAPSATAVSTTGKSLFSIND